MTKERDEAGERRNEKVKRLPAGQGHPIVPCPDQLEPLSSMIPPEFNERC